MHENNATLRKSINTGSRGKRPCITSCSFSGRCSLFRATGLSLVHLLHPTMHRPSHVISGRTRVRARVRTRRTALLPLSSTISIWPGSCFCFCDHLRSICVTLQVVLRKMGMAQRSTSAFKIHSGRPRPGWEGT